MHGYRPVESVTREIPMWDETIGPHPETACTPAEFTTMMRQLKAISGLSLRELQARARRADRSLPPSTLAAALRSQDLPRDELLRAFVQACGCEPRQVSRWREARRRLAAERASATTRRTNQGEPVGSGTAPALATSAPAAPSPSRRDETRSSLESIPANIPANTVPVRLAGGAEIPVRRRWLLPAAVVCAAGVLVLRTWRSRRRGPA